MAALASVRRDRRAWAWVRALAGAGGALAGAGGTLQARVVRNCTCLASSAGPLPGAQPEGAPDARSALAHAASTASAVWAPGSTLGRGSSRRNRLQGTAGGTRALAAWEVVTMARALLHCGEVKAADGHAGQGVACTRCGWLAEATKNGASAQDPFFCGACGAIMPLDKSVDLFRLFGMEPTFQIDTSKLEQRYKVLQRQLHPDKYASSASKEEQERSAEWSAHIIGAYYMLLRPLSRARYLMRGKIDASFDNEESTLEDQELLMEVGGGSLQEHLVQIMEMREQIEEASPQELISLKAQQEGQLRTLGQEFATAFDNRNLLVAKSLVHKMAYCTRMIEEINARL